MKKRPEDMSCYRCTEPKRLHIGDELKCPKPPRRYLTAKRNTKNGPAAGDGCYRAYQRTMNRQGVSFSNRQSEYLDRLLTMVSRGADMSVFLRSDLFTEVRKIIGAARSRAEADELASNDETAKIKALQDLMIEDFARKKAG